MKTIVSTYETRGRKFTIVYDQDRYLAINDKYLDENGCTKVSLNGFQMHADRELQGCMRKADNACRMEDLMNEGKSRAEAFCIVNGIECTDQIRKMLEGIF